MNKLKNFFFSFFIPVLILILWDISVRFSFIPNSLLASPSQVFFDFFQLLFSGSLFTHSSISLFRLLAGFIIGSVSGIVVGTIAGFSKTGETMLSPTMKILAPISPISWIPLLIVFFGIGEGSKIALIALAAFVVLYINTFQGIRATDRNLVEVSKAYKKGNKDLLFKILLPSASPNILTGMRIALGLSWILLIASEVIASSKGLGWLIWNSRNFSRPDDMIVGMITIGFLGAITDKLLTLLETKILFWRQSFTGE